MPTAATNCVRPKFTVRYFTSSAAPAIAIITRPQGRTRHLKITRYVRFFFNYYYRNRSKNWTFLQQYIKFNDRKVVVKILQGFCYTPYNYLRCQCTRCQFYDFRRFGRQPRQCKRNNLWRNIMSQLALVFIMQFGFSYCSLHSCTATM